IHAAWIYQACMATDGMSRSLGVRIRKARRAAGFPTMRALALQVPISETQVGRWERGENVPHAHLLARLAELLGVSMYWLATGRESESSYASASANPPEAA
ncbi:MAG: helix-turn-helix transcriptional regulator, partial [Myxococcota bacterium]